MAVPPRLLALDLMGTLIYDPWCEALEGATGVPCEELNKRRDIAVWHQLEIGEISEDAYWQHFADCGISADRTVFHKIRREGYRWLPGARRMLEGVQKGPWRVVIATNYPSWLQDITNGLLAEYDLPVYASYQVGARKPTAAFFEQLAKREQVKLADILLIDDDPANVAALQHLGGNGIVYTDAPSTLNQLANLRRE